MLIIAGFLFSCNSTFSRSPKNTIRLENSESPFIYSSVFDSAKIVSLNLPDSIQIASVDKLLKYKSYYILVDKKYTKGIFILDQYFNFVQKISLIGNVLKEYENIIDVTIDTLTGIFYLYDGRKINAYQLPDFSFKNAINTNNYLFGGIKFFKGGNYAYNIANFKKQEGFFILFSLSWFQEIIYNIKIKRWKDIL